MAPSGKFWMAMPMDRAKAPVRVISPCPVSMPANTTPTAIPSGMLWRVTASTSMVSRLKLLWGPSAFSLPRCRWGTSWSISSRKAMPSRKPTAAGRKASRPRWADWSMAGMSRDHTAAATITPEAKPKRAFCTRGWIWRFRKKTHPAPSVVPNRGRSSPKSSPPSKS